MRATCRKLCGLLAALIIQSTFKIAPGSEITTADFYRLPDAARHEFLISAIAARQSLLRNVKAKTTATADSFEYSSGRLGGKRAAIFVRSETYARLGASYRLDLHQKNLFKELAPDVITVSGYNSLTGESRMYGYSKQFEDGRRASARITQKQDNIVRFYLYGRLLDGAVGEGEQAYVTELLKRLKDIRVDVDNAPDGDNAVVRTERTYESYTENQTYWFDISKGFMLSRWQVQSGYPDKPNVRDDSLRVAEAAVVDDLWLPMRVTWVAGGGVNPGSATVYKVEASEVTIGKVTESDLAVTFPKGALVTDNIKGVFYYEGEERRGGPAESKARSWKSQSIVVGANLFIAGLALFLFYIRQRRGSKILQDPEVGKPCKP